MVVATGTGALNFRHTAHGAARNTARLDRARSARITAAENPRGRRNSKGKGTHAALDHRSSAVALGGEEGTRNRKGRDRLTG